MAIKYPITLVLFSLIILQVHAQRLAPEKYWIPFTDKGESTLMNTDPATFLSERAIRRRQVQNIRITGEDLPVSKTYTDSLSRMGLEILGTSRWLNAAIVRTTDTLLLERLSSEVSFVSPFAWNPDYFVHPGKKNILGIPPDNFSSRLPESENYGLSDPQISILNGNSLHDLGFRGQNMQIAVIDAGFYHVDSIAAFSKLRQEGRILGYHDFVNPNSNIFSQSSHGMSVLSTMAAYLPGTLVGTAPEASYWLLRSEDVGSEFRIEEANWLLAAEFADSAGADIITSSLGYSTFTDSMMNYSYSMLDGKSTLVTRAAEKAFSKGMLVVVSAGNEGTNPWGYITTPADGKDVLAVGAVDDTGNLAFFSSRGPTSDDRVKPDVDAVGFQTVIINPAGAAGTGYGTSFAAPQVAGMAACLWEAYPAKTNVDILQAIRRSANRYAMPDTAYGYGVPDFMIALWSIAALDSTSVSPPLIAYPNPFSASTGLSIVNAGTDLNQVHIFSAAGKLVYSDYGSWATGESIGVSDLGNLATGVYFLVARSDEEEYVIKLIKQ